MFLNLRKEERDSIDSAQRTQSVKRKIAAAPPLDYDDSAFMEENKTVLNYAKH